MHHQEEFLWAGLRGRLERTGKVRPRTIRRETVGWQPERRPEVSSHSAQPALQVAQPGARSA